MKTLIFKYLLISVLLVYASHSSAQSLSYQSFTTKDGLPNNTVYQIKQDKKGFVWMATANGLVRYGGSNFKIFNPKGIKDKDILGLFIDNQGTAWFWNLKGQLFYVIGEKVKQLKFRDSNIKILDFSQKEEGDYYFIAKDIGLFRLKKDYTYKKISHDKLAQELILMDDEFIFKIRDYIYDIDGDSTRFRFRFYVPIFGAGIKNSMIFRKINQQYWCLQQWTDELYKVKTDGSFGGFGFPQFRDEFKGGIKNIFHDNDNQYWVIMRDKILIFDAKEERLIIKIPLFLSHEVTGFLHDKEGRYWLSLDNSGIIIIPSIHIKSHINFQSVDKKDVVINTLYFNNDKLLITKNEGGIISKDIRSKKESYLKLNHNTQIQFIKKGFDNDIWIVSNDNATILDKDLKVIRNNIGNQVISYKSIYFDTLSHNLLIGNYTGVIKVSKEDYGMFIKDENKVLGWQGVRSRFAIKGISHRTYAIEKVKDEFWFGSTDGLYFYKKDSAVLSQIPELENSWITHIINQNDTVWIGTQTDGVLQVVNKKVINVFNKEQDSLSNRLASNNCKSLVIEPNGIIWIGTNKGINKINTNTGENDLINNLDGLLSSDINTLVINDKSVFVGTSEGLTSFDKNIQTKNKVPPPIYLSKFQIFDKDTILSKNYTLRHDQDNIRIHFTGISFRSQGTFTYKYRMLPISETWIETQSNIASFPILNSGEYTFEAMAINEDGVESEEPINIKILVLTPYWESWWFLGLIIILSLLGIYGYAWRLRKRLQKENNFQQKINELEMKALQAQMNPHFIFNVLNSIQHYLTINDGEQAMIYLAKFATLIRTIFDFSKNTSILLTDEIEFLQLYLGLEELRFKNKVNVSFEISEEIYTDDLRVPPLLIQPIIENAFKHGLLHVKEGHQKLNIHFLIEANWIKCIVEDNGVGREMAETKRKYKKHHSSGMKMTEERLKMWLEQQNSAVDIGEVNAFNIIDLKDENGNATGTRVEMILGENIEE